MDNAIQSFADMAVTQSSSPSPTTSLAAGLHGTVNAEKASQDFEAMFMTQMLQPMFEGLGADPVFGGGHGEEVMRTFLLQEYGKIAAKSGHLGIAAAVKNEMIKAQSIKDNSTASKGDSHAAVQ